MWVMLFKFLWRRPEVQNFIKNSVIPRAKDGMPDEAKLTTDCVVEFIDKECQ